MYFSEFFKALHEFTAIYTEIQTEYKSTITNDTSSITKQRGTLQLAANITKVDPSDSDDSIPHIVWKIDNNNIATIDAQSGLLTATGNGEVTITASLDPYGYHQSGTIKVTLSNQGIFSINLDGGNSITQPDGVLNLTANIQESGVTRADLDAVLTWEKSDDTLAGVANAVDSYNVTAIKNGTVNLIPTYTNDAILQEPFQGDPYPIEISNNGLFSILINEQEGLMNREEGIDLTAKITEDDQDRSLDDFTIEWDIVEGEDIVKKTVNEKSLHLDATASGSIKVKAKIIAPDRLKGIIISPDKQWVSPTIFKSTINRNDLKVTTKGGQLQLNAAIELAEENNTEEDAPSIVWKVNDPSLATIDENSGLLTAVKNGVITVTAGFENSHHKVDSIQVTVSNQGLFKLSIEGATTIDTNKGKIELTPKITEDDDDRSLDDFDIEWSVLTGEDLITYQTGPNKNLEITAAENGTIEITATCANLDIVSALHKVVITEQTVTATQIEIENMGNPTQLVVGDSYYVKVTLDKVWTEEAMPVIANLRTAGIKLFKAKLDDTKKILRQQFIVLKGALNLNITCLGQELNIQSLAGTQRIYKKTLANSEATELKEFNTLTNETFKFDNGVINNTTNDKITLGLMVPNNVLEFATLEWKSDKSNACSLVKIDGKTADFEIKAPNESIVITASLKYLGESYPLTTTFDIGQKTALGNTEYAISSVLSPAPLVAPVERMASSPILLNIVLTPAGAGNPRMFTYPIFDKTKGLTLKETIVRALDLQDGSNITNLEASLTENGVYAAIGDNARIGPIIGHQNENQCFAKATITNSYTYAQADNPQVNASNFADYNGFNGELLIVSVLDNKLGDWKNFLGQRLDNVEALGKGTANVFKLHDIPAPTARGKYSYIFLKEEEEYIFNIEIRKPSSDVNLNPIVKIEQELIELIQTESAGSKSISEKGISRTALMATSGSLKSGPVGAYHCSSWFKDNSTGCTLFFDSLPATKDSLIAIGHHNKANSDKGKMNIYDVHWAKGGSGIQTGSSKITL